MSRQRKRRKLKADINVVPYIDVMLVLLIIFMVTAPLLNLGVDVDLPKSKAHSLDTKKNSMVVMIDQDGAYKLKIGDGAPEPIDLDSLRMKVSAFHEQSPEAPVFLAANGSLDYQKVMDAMTLLQTAGVPRVALMSRPAQSAPAKAGKR